MADFEESNGEQNGIASRTNPSMFHACSAYAIPLRTEGGGRKPAPRRQTGPSSGVARKTGFFTDPAKSRAGAEGGTGFTGRLAAWRTMSSLKEQTHVEYPLDFGAERPVALRWLCRLCCGQPRTARCCRHRRVHYGCNWPRWPVQGM